MTLLTVTPKRLRKMNASDFKHGDIVDVGRYSIHISYISNNGTKYNRPSLCSYVEKDFRIIDCTPGIELPYYIADFLSR